MNNIDYDSIDIWIDRATYIIVGLAWIMIASLLIRAIF